MRSRSLITKIKPVTDRHSMKPLIPIRDIVHIPDAADPAVPIRVAEEQLQAADLSKWPRHVVLQTTLNLTTIHIRRIGNELDVEIITAWNLPAADPYVPLEILWATFKRIRRKLERADLPKIQIAEPDENQCISICFRIDLKTCGADLLRIAQDCFDYITGEAQQILVALANVTSAPTPIIEIIE